MNLSRVKRETLAAITSLYDETGIPPTLDEVAARRGLVSKGSVHGVINSLIEVGLVTREAYQPRTLVPTAAGRELLIEVAA